MLTAGQQYQFIVRPGIGQSVLAQVHLIVADELDPHLIAVQAADAWETAQQWCESVLGSLVSGGHVRLDWEEAESFADDEDPFIFALFQA